MLLDKLCRVRSQPGLHIAPDHGPDATESQGEGMPPAGVIIHRETCVRRDDTAGQELQLLCEGICTGRGSGEATLTCTMAQKMRQGVKRLLQTWL